MRGRRFGPYELVEPLGQGGMGEVWRAVDTRNPGRAVAVKVLRPEFGNDPELVDRFRQEAMLTAQLNSPYIVPIHDWDESDGRMYVVMPLVTGTDLGALLGDVRPLPPRRAVGIVAQVARALTTAHGAGLVHRDVKPPNIMVVSQDDGDDHVYLIDFGIARLLGGARITQNGLGLGTPPYMAPEQFDGVTDARSDVYSLACVLYECLTGALPFDAHDARAWRECHRTAPRPRPSGRVADLPAALDAAVVRGMAVDPHARFGSALDLATAARRALDAHRSPATTLTTPVAEPATVFAGTAEPVVVTDGSVLVVSAGTLRLFDVVAGGTGAWSVDVPEAAPPLFAHHTVYVGGDDGLHAFGLDGRPRWRFGTGSPVDGQAAADRDAVYVVGHDRHLYGIDAARGERRWAVPVGEVDRVGHPWRDATPAATGERVFTCGPDGHLWALDARTGGLRWRRGPLHAGAAHASCANDRIPSPVVAGGVIALVGDPSSADGALLSALDADTGATLWQRPVGKPSTAVRGCRLVAAGDRLVLRDDRGVVALDARSGSELWRVESLANTDLAVRGAAVLCLGWSGLDAYDVVDGRRLWHRPLTVDRSSARVAAGAAAVVVSDRRRLVVLDPDTGEGPPGVT